MDADSTDRKLLYLFSLPVIVIVRHRHGIVPVADRLSGLTLGHITAVGDGELF